MATEPVNLDLRRRMKRLDLAHSALADALQHDTVADVASLQSNLLRAAEDLDRIRMGQCRFGPQFSDVLSLAPATPVLSHHTQRTGYRSRQRPVAKISVPSDYSQDRAPRSFSTTRHTFVRNVVPHGRIHSSFRALVERCSERTVLNVAHVRGVLETEFANQYCLVCLDSLGENLILLEFGNGYQQIDNDRGKRIAGTVFGQFKSLDYTRFVQSAYREAWRHEQPLVEAIKVPATFDGNLPSSYERILIPVRLASGMAMLSATRPCF